MVFSPLPGVHVKYLLMERFLTAEALKKEFDPYYQLDLSVYGQLAPYLPLRSYPKSTELKGPGEIEHCARYVFKGAIAMLYPTENGRDFRVRIFKKGMVATHLESFTQQIPSPYIIKTLEYSVVLELSTIAEKYVLDNIEGVTNLSTAINRTIAQDYEAWHNIFTLPLEAGLLKLATDFPYENGKLSIKDKSHLFKCSVSKMRRTLQKLDLIG